MKKFPAVFGFLFFFAVIVSFNRTDKGQSPDKNFVNASLLSLKNHIGKLKSDSEKFERGEITAGALQKTLTNTRNSYKEIEFYIAYHYPEFAKTKLNGAPLFRIEAAGTASYTLPPEGLQVLDELIFSDEIQENRAKITEISSFLYNSYNSFYLSGIQNGISSGKNKTLPLRMNLVRIYALGLSGFDTPGSLNAIQEAKYSFEGMLKFIESDSYFSNFQTDRVRSLLQKGIVYLSQPHDFESFDRIGFYKNYIQPLYAEMGKWDGDVEELPEISGWNPSSDGLFSSDLLDPYFYTLLKESEDNEALRQLGKTVFFDSTLSGNSKMSCATCHLPEKAFTDGVAKSESNVEGKTVLRNSPSLYNAVFARRFFYDLRAFYLEQQAEHVIYNEQEFNTSYESIIEKMKLNPEYRKSFGKVFKDGKINKQNFSRALASYVASLYSFDSDFDRFMRNEKTISKEAQQGFNLFMGKAACATCHFVPHFSGLVPPFYNENESEVLGVTKQPLQKGQAVLDEDLGRAGSPVTKEKSWIFENSFKTVTARNIALTAPYFHNGAFETLEEVMEFYNEGGGAGIGLQVDNQTLAPDKLNLSEKEISEIIAFLQTLTDNSKSKN